MSRFLVIDESLTDGLATELAKRGYEAASVKTLGLTGRKDPDLLGVLDKRPDPWVLVTADDKMPFEHRDLILELGTTIATIDGQWESFCARHGLSHSHSQFARDAVHRWAHVMVEQGDNEIRRYNPRTHGNWRPRTKYEG